MLQQCNRHYQTNEFSLPHLGWTKYHSVLPVVKQFVEIQTEVIQVPHSAKLDFHQYFKKTLGRGGKMHESWLMYSEKINSHFCLWCKLVF